MTREDSGSTKLSASCVTETVTFGTGKSRLYQRSWRCSAYFSWAKSFWQVLLVVVLLNVENFVKFYKEHIYIFTGGCSFFHMCVAPTTPSANISCFHIVFYCINIANQSNDTQKRTNGRLSSKNITNYVVKLLVSNNLSNWTLSVYPLSTVMLLFCFIREQCHTSFASHHLLLENKEILSVWIVQVAHGYSNFHMCEALTTLL